jgi:RNA methyltransferase, TrmH family
VQPKSQFRQIESKQNATIKALRKAFASGELTEDGCVAIEGMKIVAEAVRSGLRFKALIVNGDVADIHEPSAPFSYALDPNTELIAASDEVFRSAVDTENPQSIAALVFPTSFSLKDMLAHQDGVIVVLAGLQDPGNLGTIIRSAEAFGAAGVILSEGTVSRFNAKVVRASAGSVFRLPCVAAKMSLALKELRKAGARLVGTSSHKGVPIEQSDLLGRIALVIGSEGSGLPDEVMAGMDEFVKIQQAEDVESLNAGVATSIILYEAARQRRQSR